MTPRRRLPSPHAVFRKPFHDDGKERIGGAKRAVVVIGHLLLLKLSPLPSLTMAVLCPFIPSKYQQTILSPFQISTVCVASDDNLSACSSASAKVATP